MDKKICLKCSTENEGNFVFCKYCGAMLPVVDKRFNYPHTEDVEEDSAEPEVFGIPLSDMTAYIGKRPHKFIPKFIRMEATNQKISTCIPVLLLGLLFGFFGMALWFFWRKMSKIGSVFVLLGLVMSFANIAVNFSVYSAYIDGLSTAILSSSDTGLTAEALVEAFEAGYNPIISLISQYVEYLIVPAIASLFALHFYKNKACADIKYIKENPTENLSEDARIALKGGCSGALLLIPIFAGIFPTLIMCVICLV